MSENSNKGLNSGRALFLASLALVIASLIAMPFLLSGMPHSYTDPRITRLYVRGSILDRNGSIIALDAPEYGLEISCPEEERPRYASIASAYSNLDALTIESMLGSASFIPLAYVPDTETLSMLSHDSTLRKEGIGIAIKENRVYLEKKAFENLIGEVDESGFGISGIERSADRILRPSPEIDRDIAYGRDVVLTIDRRMQLMLYSAMKGSKAAIFSESGEILAYTGPADKTVLNAIMNPGSIDAEHEKLLQSSSRKGRWYIFPSHSPEIEKAMQDAGLLQSGI